MYFHTDSPTTLDFLSRVLTLAEEQSQSVRMSVDDFGHLRIKRGEGMWSSPIVSTPDSYRDTKDN